MDADFLTVFVDAAAKVLETMAKTKAVPGDPALKTESTPGALVSGAIAFHGEITGHLTVAFTHPAIQEVYAGMLGEVPPAIGKEVLDTCGELANMICGEARKSLYDLGYHIAAGIPKVKEGWAEPEGDGFQNIQPVYVPLSIKKGGLTLRLGIVSKPGASLIEFHKKGKQKDPWEAVSHGCPLHEPPFRFVAYAFKASEAAYRPDLFCLPAVTVKEGEFSTVQAIAQSVVVCPRCLFATKREDLFSVNGNRGHRLFIRNEIREAIKTQIGKRTINLSLKEIINNRARSVDLAFTAFNLAIISSEALILHGGVDFTEEQDYMGEYALMSALMHKARKDPPQEKKMLEMAERFLLKRLPFQRDANEVKSLYRLAMMNIYLDNEAKAAKHMASLVAKAKAFKNLPETQKKVAADSEKYLVMAHTAWGKKSEIKQSITQDKTDYLFF
ncbi:MAG: DUF2225 domain-containing protein [Deltaproteobacteria bacterium]|nr:DUF2225 domain-containing protein [Deltaproteobacteria bacterium]